MTINLSPRVARERIQGSARRKSLRKTKSVYRLTMTSQHFSALVALLCVLVLFADVSASPSRLKCLDDRELRSLRRTLSKNAHRIHEYEKAVKLLGKRLRKAKGDAPMLCLTDRMLSASLVECAFYSQDLRIPDVIFPSQRTARPDPRPIELLDLRTRRAGRRVIVLEPPVRVVDPSTDPLPDAPPRRFAHSARLLLHNIRSALAGEADADMADDASSFATLEKMQQAAPIGFMDPESHHPLLFVHPVRLLTHAARRTHERLLAYAHPLSDQQPASSDPRHLSSVTERSSSALRTRTVGEPRHYRGRVFTKIAQCGEGFPCCVFGGSFPDRQRACFDMWCQEHDGC